MIIIGGVNKVEYVNLNPKGWKTGDCVIRACAKATGISWDDTYKTLFEIGFKKKRLPNDDHVYDKFLLDNGFEYCKTYRDEYGNRVPVWKLVNEMQRIHPGCTLVIHTRKHLTCAVDGKVYDTWCTEGELAGYFYIKY